MKLSSYLKDRLILIVLQIVVSIYIAVLLNVFDIAPFASVLSVITINLITAMALIFDYTKRAHYYGRLYANLNAMDHKMYIASLMDPPEFADAEILCDVTRQTTKAMNDSLAELEVHNQEYREYIQTWIHEVKLPISGIMLLCDNNTNPVTQSIASECEKIESYVEQALYYAKSTTLEKDYIIKKVSLDTLVKNALKRRSKQLISASAEIVTENLDEFVYADTKWLDFILGQLITNSIKYKKDKLTLTFSSHSTQGGTVLSVRDNGIGIPSQDLNRVFENGFTGENGRKYSKSTGIGLYICKNLCNKMNLSISAKSNDGCEIDIAFPSDILEIYE